MVKKMQGKQYALDYTGKGVKVIPSLELARKYDIPELIEGRSIDPTNLIYLSCSNNGILDGLVLENNGETIRIYNRGKGWERRKYGNPKKVGHIDEVMIRRKIKKLQEQNKPQYSIGMPWEPYKEIDKEIERLEKLLGDRIVTT